MQEDILAADKSHANASAWLEHLRKERQVISCMHKHLVRTTKGRNFPWQPITPYLRGWRFTPVIWGVEGLKPLVWQCFWCSTPLIIKAEKDTQTQRFHQESHAWIHLFLGAFNPRNSLCSGCVFSLKCRKNANTKNLKGGDGGQKKIFVLDFFGCFFRSLD